ncbi:hypothetical protein EPO15_02715 [bacterium]|nr:MAG: hypothetical protein EPO15_02715 [bacterium]
MKRLRGLAPAAALALAAFLAYGGPRLFRLGFYHDDWWFLSVLRFSAPDFSGRLGGLLADSQVLLLRPLDAPALAGLFSLFGTEPLGWQAAALTACLFVALGARRLLVLYGASEGVALVGAVLALAYPNKEGAMFWPMAAIVPFSFAFFVWASVHHIEWVKDGRRWRLRAAGVCLLASLAFYDQSFFQAAAWALLPFAAEGERRRRSVQGLATAAGVVALFAVYKFVVVPRVFGVVFNKPLILTVTNALWVSFRALESCFGWRLFASAAGAVAAALRSAPFAAVAALALPWAALRAADRGPGAEPGAVRRLASFGAALWVLGYLPIMVSDYRPTPFSHMNRINYVPAFGLALAAASVALSGAHRRRWEALGATLAGFFLAAHVGFAGYWAEAAGYSEAARRIVQARLSAWPADAVLLFNQPTLMVGRRAPLFLASWDATGAVRVWTGDASREADSLRPGVRFLPAGVAISERLLPYAHVRVLDLRSQSLVPLNP